MSKINLGVTADARVIEVRESNEDYKRVILKVPLPYAAQREFFQQSATDGMVFFDWRARAARLGFDATLEKDNPSLSDPDTFKSDNLLLSLKIWPFLKDYFPRNGAPWSRVIGYEKWPAGKLVAYTPEFVPSVDDLQKRVDDGRLILPRRSNIGKRRIQLRHCKFEPVVPALSEASVREALLDLPREQIRTLQREVRSGTPKVEMGKPIITMTHIYTGDLSFILGENQGTARSTSARHVSPESGLEMFVGLTLDHQKEISQAVMPSVTGTFVKKNIHKSRVLVPGFDFKSLREGRNLDSGAYSLNYGIWVKTPRNTQFEKLSPLDATDPKSLEQLVRVIKGCLQGTDFYFNTFPPTKVLDEFRNSLVANKVGRLVFCTPPINDEAFSDSDMFDLKGLEKRGIEVIWDHAVYGPLRYYKMGFIGTSPADTEQFDALYPNNVVSIFGSARQCKEQTVVDIENALRALQLFGPKWLIANGGGPGVMKATSQKAKSLGYLTAVVSIAIPQEQQIQEEAPFVYMPIGDRHINDRQKVLVDLAKGKYLVFPGGFGTQSEIYEVMTKFQIAGRVGFCYMIGTCPSFKKTQGVFNALKEEGMISPENLTNFRLLPSGDKVLEALLEQYHFEKPKNF